MNTAHLKYFLEVAESLNISQTAKKLFISQQALSNQILKLEESMNITLFERKPSLKLTYAGERLYAMAKDILEKEAALEKEFEEIHLEERGTVTIGISHTRGRVFLPLVLPAFHRQFPNVEIKLKEGNSKLLKAYLDEGIVDIVIAADQFPKSAYETEHLKTEQLFWCYTEGFAAAIEKGNLEQVPFVLVIRENRIRNIIDGYFARRGICPKILMESDNIETVLSLAAEGMGVTVYPEMFLENRRSVWGARDALSFRPVGDSLTDTVLVAAWKKGKYVNKFEKAFLTLCKETASRKTGKET